MVRARLRVTVCNHDGSQPGFECSCSPPEDDLDDRTYLLGRPGCKRYERGYLGKVNDGTPSTPKFGYLDPRP
eukprot:2107101-Rhodomonas_salina.1